MKNIFDITFLHTFSPDESFEYLLKELLTVPQKQQDGIVLSELTVLVGYIKVLKDLIDRCSLGNLTDFDRVVADVFSNIRVHNKKVPDCSLQKAKIANVNRTGLRVRDAK